MEAARSKIARPYQLYEGRKMPLMSCAVDCSRGLLTTDGCRGWNAAAIL
jgi:hypothetical protein